MAQEETSVVGEDGELVQPDTDIDREAYAEYVASTKSRSTYTMNEWDDARIAEALGKGCVFLIGIIAAAELVGLILASLFGIKVLAQVQHE